MPNYFRSNRPGVVRIEIPADVLSAPLGIQVQAAVEVPFRTDDLQDTYGEDDAGGGKQNHWVEYRVPGTDHVKRVERMVAPDGSSSDEKPVGGDFKKPKGQQQG